MTVVTTSMRNFVAHKGRMALSAVAVLLSVAFVCGTLVFTDTMNPTVDKLFAVTSSDVTVAPKDAKSEETPQNGVPESLPASALEQIRGVEGVKSAQGSVTSTNVTVVDRDNDKNPVVALREIADERFAPGDMREDLIHSLQKHVEVDEPEPEAVPAMTPSAAKTLADPEAGGDVQFDRMTE